MPMSKTKKIQGIRRVKKILSRGWCKGFWALNKEGASVDIMNHRACAWCLRGAIARAVCELKFPLNYIHAMSDEIVQDFPKPLSGKPRRRFVETNGDIIMRFNDAEETALNVIKDCLDKTVKRLQQTRKEKA